jgi:hypothetical protein
LQDPGQIERSDRRIKLVTALSALDLPGIDRLPRSYQIMVRAMNRIPPLGRAGLLLRYEFSR